MSGWLSEPRTLRVSAGFTAVCAVVTFVLCAIISSSEDVDFGGLTYPYLSDTGREKPAFYLFAIGLTLSSLAAGVAAAAEASALRRHAAVVDALKSRGCCCTCCSVSVLIYTALGFHIASIPGGILVGTVSTRTSTGLHSFGASLFFAATIVAVIINTAVVWRLVNAGRVALTTSLRIKQVAVAVAFLAFLVYQPIGWVLLAKCDSPEVDGVYNYRECKEEHHARTVTQHLFVLCSLVLVMSYILDAFDASTAQKETTGADARASSSSSSAHDRKDGDKLVLDDDDDDEDDDDGDDQGGDEVAMARKGSSSPSYYSYDDASES